jgi:two-component system chemotaxis response regulator CheB
MSIRVLVVDDSAIVRQSIERQLSQTADIEVIGTAPDPYIARDKILQLCPDVVTLDIEMPRMDGITFLRKIMKYRPVPVVIVSSLAKKGSQVALDALSAGAVDVIAKAGEAYSLGDMTVELVEKIRAAAAVNMEKILSQVSTAAQPKSANRLSMTKTTNKVLVIGASTGGTQAIESIITQFPSNCPPTVIVQHMPAGFTKSFAERLNNLSAPEVKEAENGETIIPGRVLIAPGNFHTLVKRSGAQYFVEIKEGPLVDQHRPSVSVLFQTAAQFVGANAVAVMLTGMGSDGAKGMLKIKEAGGITIAQDEKSCVVYGMPRAAVECGAVQEVLPLSEIAAKIIIKMSDA